MRNEILEYFRKANGEYVSGQQISDALKVSRTAIWKHIKVLKDRGYIFESSTKKGYRLVYAPDLLTPLEVSNELKTDILGKRIVYMEITKSSNNEAKMIAAQGAENGTLVIAEEQTGGRGRLTRNFYSPFAKGIWMSLILTPKFLPMEASKCTLMAAVAVCKAVRQFGLTEAGIKWPNDVLYKGKKLVGILTEMSSSMEKIDYIVVGIGINTGIKENEFPEEVRGRATSFLNEGIEISRKELLAAVLFELEKNYIEVEKYGFANILEEWRKLTVTLGKNVQIISYGETYTGKAQDIDQDGCLLVKTDKGIKRVIVGDVSIRPAGNLK